MIQPCIERLRKTVKKRILIDNIYLTLLTMNNMFKIADLGAKITADYLMSQAYSKNRDIRSYQFKGFKNNRIIIRNTGAGGKNYPGRFFYNIGLEFGDRDYFKIFNFAFSQKFNNIICK